MTDKKREVKKGFGGLWIDNPEEYAKFASSTINNTYEKDGEGISYTANHFYAYYHNMDGEAIPYADIYLNEEQSQEVIKQVYDAIISGKDRK